MVIASNVMAFQKRSNHVGVLLCLLLGLLAEMEVLHEAYVSSYTAIHMCCLSYTQDFIFPENAALPIGGADKIHTHVLLEMHYDNPDEVSGKLL